ncbi:hypothetical protein EYR41_003460 [Orbilia oligospora]|uniref:Uncharacterized protein n=1 Tax=Orbilia oligospora TaxID=2813651 RepID=A0A8H2E5Y4_ORBOL|nr:hypothetical protein EYR41_003460 [Orbilia oligospora]
MTFSVTSKHHSVDLFESKTQTRKAKVGGFSSYQTVTPPSRPGVTVTVITTHSIGASFTSLVDTMPAGPRKSSALVPFNHRRKRDIGYAREGIGAPHSPRKSSLSPEKGSVGHIAEAMA